MAETPYRKGLHNIPTIVAGELVVPTTRSYSGWDGCEPRLVEEVVCNSEGDRWGYKIRNPISPVGYSIYNCNNFDPAPAWAQALRQETKMPIERTKFFALKLTDGAQVKEGLLLEAVGHGVGDMHRVYMTTPQRDSQHEVRVDVNARLKEGDRWLVVQTVCLFEGESPRPPIRVTEYSR